MASLVVIALGGNAILKPGQKGTAAEQLANVRTTCNQIADLLAAGYGVVVTHGNGPQVGNIIIQNQSTSAVPAMPMDICGAQSQGMVGYMIQSCLRNALAEGGLDETRVTTVVAQTLVDPADAAFAHPTKPVGPFRDQDYAAKRSAEAGETWAEDSGRGWRRVVPSPDPKELVDLPAIQALVRDGFVVISCGGGGVPVIRVGKSLRGVEAVVDKDLAAQKLATGVGADVLLILTDVSAAALDYGKPSQHFLSRLSLAEARSCLTAGHFKPGSMGPKVEACCRFVEAGGARAVICALTDALAALEGSAGTTIVP